MTTSYLLVSAASTCALGQQVDFARDIRPIISENCVFCHGPDVEERQADLRLDTESGTLTSIEPNDRDASELYSRITHDDPDLQMPPPDSNRKLTAKQIELIGNWIDQGAKWEQHWSFKPLVKPDVPKVTPTPEAPVRNPIDSFVQSRLQKEPLAPSPEANREALIRRLSLDLTGLPPTPAEVDAFLADESPEAYDRVVTRLLNSPAYGQRMAWAWLDAARYADSNGYQGDNERTMWPWRDWVVKAFNDNMPYDEFTIQQLAGDLLPGATEEQKLATAFCRNHMINGEGGRIAEENRVEYVMDMSETMGTVWLGLTLNCCRCHDHKYDPITNREYYQFFAFFNQTPVTGSGRSGQTAPILAVSSANQKARLATISREISLLDEELRELAKALRERQPTWEKEHLAELAAATTWHTLKPTKAEAEGQSIKVLDDRSLLTSGANPANDTYTVVAPIELSTVSAVRLEALRHESMTKGRIARSDSGNFVLTSFEVSLVDEKAAKRTPLKIVQGEATFEQGSLKIGGTFDKDPKTGWAVLNGGSIDRDHVAVLRFGKPIDVPAGATFEFVLRHDSKHRNHNLGRFRLSVSDVANPSLATNNDALATALRLSKDKRSKEQQSLIEKSHREVDPNYSTKQQRRDRLNAEQTKIRQGAPKVMVMQDMEKPRQSFMLSRGLYNKPLDKVTREFPKFLPQLDSTEQTPDRLALARWLVDDKNPLPARVTVNRFWQQIFGIGLVKTTEDFGRQGEIPVHMDLLNWLATDFRDNGWDVKELMRTIVTSHTYRQSSRVTRATHEIDPNNRLLARGSRYRMPSWMIRDQALAASGLLSPVSTGPSVNTYQPAGVWEEASFGKKKYARDTGEKLYRRSLYVFWRRIIAPTMFFDAATRQTCTVKATRTNTPLHALQTLNNVAFVEAARVLAEKALRSDAKNDAARLDYVFRRLLARPATSAERDVLVRGLERTRQEFQADVEAAKRLVMVGETKRDDSIDAAEHASWTSLCLAVLNLDETLNRE